MKKFLTLTLVFLMVLAMAMPALAFSAVEPEEDDDSIPYEIDIYLIEWDDEDVLGLPSFSLPPSDRGYAKNEIVAALAKLYVPKKTTPIKDGYRKIILSGDNVKLAVADNWPDLTRSANWKSNLDGAFVTKSTPASVLSDNELVYEATQAAIDAAEAKDADDAFYNSKDQTYAAIFFAKVTGDDAFMSAAFKKSLGFVKGKLDLDDYIVGKPVKDDNGNVVNAEDYSYVIYNDKGTVKLFAIEVGSKNASKALYVYLTDANAGVSNTGGWWRVGVDSNGYYFSSEDASYIEHDPKDIHRLDHITIEQESDAKRAYNALLDIVEDVFEDDFGFSYDYIGNVINDKTFTGIESTVDLYAEVAIEPWYAYVEVPPEIVVDPPKTGDAMSIVGFALIALAGLAVVAIRKVRA
ncbi:hypothetical protein LJC07_05910 [Christensenellaceae bacterium OttesenSCG-928-L17]|nr:hypothetical protein [Christensenellaceae bacterium OttesenSCG-928-L17]